MVGAAGRMGQTIVALSQSFSNSKGALSLCGALETKDSPSISKDAGSLAGLGPLGIPITGDLGQALEGAQVAIDFFFS